MNIEDGDDLPIGVTIKDDNGRYWHCQMAALPRAGEVLVLASAPKGTTHTVEQIIHHVGGANHRIVIIAKEEFVQLWSVD